MLPVGVVGRSKYKPYLTYGLIAANVVVFLWELSVNAKGQGVLSQTLASIAFNVCEVGVEPLHNLFLDNLRSMFLHGSVGHLLGNMLFLYVFGRRVEEYYGRWPFLGFYLIAGTLATISHVLFGGVVCAIPRQKAIVIGASGAIAGVMGAFLFLYPTARVDTIIGIFRPLFWRARLPAIFFLLYWFIMDFLHGIGWLYSMGIAHWAHIGGFIGGLFLTFFAVMLYRPAPEVDPFEYLDE